MDCAVLGKRLSEQENKFIEGGLYGPSLFSIIIKQGVCKHNSKQTTQYRLSDRRWGLFVELLTVIERLFDGIDEMELIEKLMNDDEVFEIICRILPIKVQSQTAA